MNEKTDQVGETGRDEETLTRLLQLAGPRAPVPPDAEARVYERVRSEWLASSQQPDSARVYDRVHRTWERRTAAQNARRWAMPLALAASVILAVAVFWQPPVTRPPPVSVGTVARVAGTDTAGMLPEAGSAILAGVTLSTANGQGLSITLRNAASLRLDENTTLVVDSGNEFRLTRGRLYADTGDLVYRDRALVIGTPLGRVTDVGTQFVVGVIADGLGVAVREGRVDVQSQSDTFVAIAGQRMRLDRDDGATFDTIEPDDPYWDWTATLAPAFDIENRSLLDFLRWAARETGRELEFESNDLRMTAMRTDLHGSVADFEPLDAVESVLATTSFRYRLAPGRIVVTR